MNVKSARQCLNGSLTDVVEMDAASNNSVEDIREIRDEVNFLPTLAKYRVYIIDEVHMLSTGAFNALLKTLEEPPEHVKFILATTEPQKLPATILSRCQRFDFKRISVEDIIKRLEIICKESNIKITEEALRMIAVLSEGALRDAISILERCAQDEADMIDEDQIRELVGIPKLTYIRNLTTAIFGRDAEKAIEEVQNIISQGKDLDNFLWEIIKYIKDILVYKSTKKLELYSKEEIEYIDKLSSEVEKSRLLELIYDLSELANTMKWSTQKNIIFETGIIKECLDVRTEQLEVRNIVVTEKPKTAPKTEVKPKTEKQENKKVSESTVKSSGTYVPYWTTILDKIKAEGKIMIYTNLIGTKAKLIDDMTVGIEFPSKLSEFAKKVLNEYENKAIIEKLVSMEQGNTMRVKYLGNDAAEEKPKDDIENLANKLNIPINIIDE
ncbi:MAG: DNA polymerase III subunit gamma/tau [Clostridia bacterium]|nr:DNA polymerase III subunit gamma/tau [Clostridia bacterium]